MLSYNQLLCSVITNFWRSMVDRLVPTDSYWFRSTEKKWLLLKTLTSLSHRDQVPGLLQDTDQWSATAFLSTSPSRRTPPPHFPLRQGKSWWPCWATRSRRRQVLPLSKWAKNAVFLLKIHFLATSSKFFCYHHDRTPKRQGFCVEPVARGASGWPPRSNFCSKIFIFYAKPI